jgi:hypothetical protein
MKVYKNKFAHINLLLFILLSLIYLLIVFAFSHGDSFFSKTNITSFISQQLPVILIFPFVFYSVFLFKKYAKYLLFIFLGLILFNSFVLLASSFNKLILGLTFIYALFSFYFYSFWEIERGEAGYNPLFSANDLEKNTRFTIKGIIYSNDRQKSESIYLTNIDEKSCFVILEKDLILFEKPLIEITIDGVTFSSPVVAVSQFDKGMGFIFEETEQSPWSLSELCKICRDRGLFLV